MERVVAQARSERRTTFFSSHLIDEVERCADRIGIIHAGRMRWEGSLSSLRNEVRRLAGGADQLRLLPAGFEVWKKEGTSETSTWIVRAEAETWTALPPGLTLHPRQPSLEEVFIACVSHGGNAP